MPLRLEEDWNSLRINLASFTKRAYGTNFKEAVRLRICSSCYLRRAYFADVEDSDVPDDFRLVIP
ncbi:hypothetical protein MHBO_000921 [Bonamia ostreae]|uniref:CFA20 domain-containing protein n=1 Tax=Bonamia ostreae TaxID=126728 RepID=A0ABV2AHG4_9EUKA